MYLRVATLLNGVTETALSVVATSLRMLDPDLDFHF